MIGARRPRPMAGCRFRMATGTFPRSTYPGLDSVPRASAAGLRVQAQRRRHGDWARHVDSDSALSRLSGRPGHWLRARRRQGGTSIRHDSGFVGANPGRRPRLGRFQPLLARTSIRSRPQTPIPLPPAQLPRRQIRLQRHGEAQFLLLRRRIAAIPGPGCDVAQRNPAATPLPCTGNPRLMCYTPAQRKVWAGRGATLHAGAGGRGSEARHACTSRFIRLPAPGPGAVLPCGGRLRPSGSRCPSGWS